MAGTFNDLPREQRLLLLICYAAKRAGCKEGIHPATILKVLSAIDADDMDDKEIESMRASLTTDVQACRRLIYEERR